jgi:hypothetical protein
LAYLPPDSCSCSFTIHTRLRSKAAWDCSNVASTFRWLASGAPPSDKFPLPLDDAAALLQTMFGHDAVVDRHCGYPWLGSMGIISRAHSKSSVSMFETSASVGLTA